MNFKNILGNFQSQMKKASIARKTQKGLDRYRNSSGEVKFPRIFGYRETGKSVAVVEEEAKSVRIILGMLALGRSPAEIKQEMDKRGARNRSGDRFCEDEIRRMVKPVYMGKIQAASGKMIDAKFYQAIVSPEIWKKAQKALKRLTEGSNSAPLVIGERVSLTFPRNMPSPNTKWAFLGLP